MDSIPDRLACFSWNVQQRTTATLQTTGCGVTYDEYVMSTVIGFIEEGEGIETFIGLQGLSTIAFKKLQSCLALQYDGRVICHFTPHSMSCKEWQRNYEIEVGVDERDSENNANNQMPWFGNMVIYFIGLDTAAFSAEGVVINCDSYELPGGSSAMPCIHLCHKDGTALHLICIHSAKSLALQAEQQVQLSQVLCETRADLTLIAGVIHRPDCILPGYNNTLQASAVASYPSHEPVVASSDVWALNADSNTTAIEQTSANALRLLHIEQISNYLPVSRTIRRYSLGRGSCRRQFGCTIN